MKLPTIILVALGLTCSPTIVIADIQDANSSDIMAEIDFLERIFPDRPQIEQIRNTEENALLNYLSSYAICEGWDYKEYDEFVSSYERELLPFVRSGRTLRISLTETSYEARVENGCEINDDAKSIFEGIFGSVEGYYTSLKNRELILEAIDERKNEMLRRTLGDD